VRHGPYGTACRGSSGPTSRVVARMAWQARLFRAYRGFARQARRGHSCRNLSGPGRQGKTLLVGSCLGSAWQACLGIVRHRVFGQVRAVGVISALLGVLRFVAVRLGRWVLDPRRKSDQVMARQARFRSVWLVGVRQGRQGPEVWAVSVQAWRGRPSVARDGFSRLVTAVRVCPGCLRTAGRGRQGEARFYLVRHGRCGKARATCLGWHGRPGWARLHKSWEGASCRGKAARQWHGTSRLV
jgi:hypothetical protein